MTIHAVLTGDIIDSRHLGTERLDAAFASLAAALALFRPGGSSPWVGGLERFRGDSWQICLAQPAAAFHAAVYIRTGLRSAHVDTRIGIGIGPIDHLDPDRLSASTGPAFTRSGGALDGLGPHRALAIDAGDGALHDALAAVALLLDAQLALRSARECLAIHAMLRGLSHAEAAQLAEARLPDGRAPSRPAISGALSRASWQRHLEPALAAAASALHLGFERVPPTSAA